MTQEKGQYWDPTKEYVIEDINKPIFIAGEVRQMPHFVSFIYGKTKTIVGEEHASDDLPTIQLDIEKETYIRFSSLSESMQELIKNQLK